MTSLTGFKQTSQNQQQLLHLVMVVWCLQSCLKQNGLEPETSNPQQIEHFCRLHQLTETNPAEASCAAVNLRTGAAPATVTAVVWLLLLLAC